jgi:hypothetical protein
MTRILLLTIVTISAAYLIGCGESNTHANRQVDVVDRDFVATISATNTPLVLDVKIQKVSKEAKKQIDAWPPVVDFVLKDSNGKVYKPDYKAMPTYTEGVDATFGDIRKSGPADSISGKVRLRTTDLKAGSYTVTPQVRIQETGEGALSGPYNDGGTVAVPAGNSLKVNIQ